MKQRISLVEYGIFRYPEGLEGWRCFRMEYGGHAQDCIKECVIWLPPQFDIFKFEKELNECQD